MQGLIRLSYILGWVCLALAFVGRLLLYTSLQDRMIQNGVLPHNALQMSFLFFLITVASYVYTREKP